MSIQVLLVQLLVLVFTGALWWIARRDLTARPPAPLVPPPAAETAELEQLCATLEVLVTSLARRLDAVERQASARPPAPEPLPPMQPLPSMQPLLSMQTMPQQLPTAFERPKAAPEPAPVPEPMPDPRYAPVYALLDAGVSDPLEIARQTGLGRGEVDLILSLRDRRAF